MHTKKALQLFFLFIFLVSAYSCSKDDTVKSPLIGTWESVSVSAKTTVDNDVTEEFYEYDASSQYTFTFNSDMTAIMHAYFDDIGRKINRHFKYEVNGNHLLIYEKNDKENGIEFTYSVKGNELFLTERKDNVEATTRFKKL